MGMELNDIKCKKCILIRHEMALGTAMLYGDQAKIYQLNNNIVGLMLGFVNHLNLKRHATIVTHKLQFTRRKCRNRSVCIGSGGTRLMSLFWLLMKKVVIYDA